MSGSDSRFTTNVRSFTKDRFTTSRYIALRRQYATYNAAIRLRLWSTLIETTDTAGITTGSMGIIIMTMIAPVDTARAGIKLR